MTKKKITVVAVGAIVLGIAWSGVRWYRDYRRECADKRANVCLREYSRLIGDGKSALPVDKLKPLLAEMAELSKACSEDWVESLFARRLDGAFLVGDYALAEGMMDDMPGKSENWKTGAKAKIRAHAALARGDKAAAIDEFEAFCQTLLKGPPDAIECDPCSGVAWTVEALLARNKKRMSDLAAEIGDKDRSAKFLAEARGYAKTALEKAKDDADTTEELSRELGALLDK